MLGAAKTGEIVKTDQENLRVEGLGSFGQGKPAS